MERLYCIIIGYGFGLFQTAFIYGKMHGIDIREHGSGNAGTTNTLRVLGTKAGLIVLAGDIIKTILAIVVCELLFGKTHPQEVYLLKLYAAAGAILGHNFPFYLKFRGGKGIASTAGLVLAFHPLFIPVGVLIFFGIFFTTHYVSLGSLLVYLGILAEMVFMGQTGFFGAPQGIRHAMYIVTLLLTAMAYYKHRENIKRLLKGQERKTYLTKKNEDK